LGLTRTDKRLFDTVSSQIGVVLVEDFQNDVSVMITEFSSLLLPIAFLLIILGGLLLATPGMPKKFGKNFVMIGITFVFLSGFAPYIFPLLINTLSGMPWWFLILVTGLIVISALQAFVAIFIGWRAANAFAGNLATSLVKGIFTALMAPLKALRSFFEKDT
jgi:hypothetical protein